VTVLLALVVKLTVTQSSPDKRFEEVDCEREDDQKGEHHAHDRHRYVHDQPYHGRTPRPSV
jgi:hypothetical protein